jgi:hypothetical protein
LILKTWTPGTKTYSALISIANVSPTTLLIYIAALSEQLKHIYKSKVFAFSSHQQQFVGAAAQLAREQVLLPDLLIFEPEGTLVHVEFRFQDKSVHVYLVRKEGPFLKLTPSEDRLIRQVMNNIAFYLWKNS